MVSPRYQDRVVLLLRVEPFATNAVVLVMFRGITPCSPDYAMTSLITDACRLFDLKVENSNSASFSKFEIVEGTADEMQKAFREKCFNIFILDRGYACQALKEGVTLDGRFTTILFRVSEMLLVGI